MAPYPFEQRALIVVFFGAMTALILTFTCANMAGLVLARASARRHEVSLRLALGAGRVRMVRQLLAESVLLAIAGGAGGLAATYGFVELLTRVVAASPLFRLAVQLTPDSRVAALTFLVSVSAGIALGLMPALALTRTDLISGLKGQLGASLARYHRFGLRNLFMVYQITAAMALVVIMGFLVLGIQSGASRDAGFAAEGLSVLSLDPVRDGYSLDEAAGVLAGLPERLTEADNVEAAALMDSRLFQQFVRIAVLLRTREGDGLDQARRGLNRIDPNLTMFNWRTIGDQLDDLYMVNRFTQAIYVVVGLFALVLASVGLASVTAHTAMRRRKEIGIRMALGARSLQVLGLVMREGAIMTTLGACIGVAFAYGLARLLMAIDSQLGQALVLSTGNPMRLLAGPAILVAVTAVACYLPARRSANLNPLVALREE